ncbi:MAG: nickel-type superoxide dismutase maturation protease [Pseudomonadota bacterium]
MGVGRVTVGDGLPGWRTTREVLLWLLGRRRRFRVVNQSMQPTLQAGGYVLVDPNASAHGDLRPGELVVACHPRQPDLIVVKRVAAIQPGGIVLLSDNPSGSEDSRHFGPVPHALIRGRVTHVIH